MRLIDEEFLRHPFIGSRRLCDYLQRAGYFIIRKRIQRLMRLMGLEAVYPKLKTSTAHPQHKIYPYLLHQVEVGYPNHVWSTDITYLPMPTGFMYLVAIMDWYSRYVLACELSNTLDGYFCLDALHQRPHQVLAQQTPAEVHFARR
ncbi:MAG: IS3 family transposase [Candidatus Latescibacteria bacterium]|nr:IS3 family transposase [Candidatus Latescibacterota bacterium]